MAGVDCWCPEVGWAGEPDPGGWSRSQRTWRLDGTVWRRRGEGVLGAVALGRLVRRGQPRVFHADAGAVHEHVGAGRVELLETAGRAAGRVPVGGAAVEAIALRDDDRGVALLVMESC
ncbi:hypothetical protein [Nocardioides zeae]|uniref:hypothetical protein n=1 Tax=Nocardioides zeae TaxID=1457234 RepID=UPI00286CDB35|nr:hypothetical protein [Nocardioides zeae]